MQPEIQAVSCKKNHNAFRTLQFPLLLFITVNSRYHKARMSLRGSTAKTSWHRQWETLGWKVFNRSACLKHIMQHRGRGTFASETSNSSAYQVETVDNKANMFPNCNLYIQESPANYSMRLSLRVYMVKNTFPRWRELMFVIATCRLCLSGFLFFSFFS